MIKVHKNDSIVDIIIKIKNNTEKEIVLEFPFGHPVLHNYTSLKILKNKAEKRDLIIITNDKTAKKIGKTLGIKYSIVDNPDIVGYNYSFWEYLVYTFKSYFREIKDLLFFRGDNSITGKYRKKYADSKIGYFITAFFICFILMIFIFYFAVNKTYIYITPKIEVKYKAKNFIFREMGDEELALEDNVIKLKKIEKTISITEKFGTSGISNDSVSNARGKVTLFNMLENKIDLVGNTRLQTSSGVVFLIEGPVSIPGSTKDGTDNITPGTIDAYVISRNQDADGKISGSRANISKGEKMFLPGLKENKDDIYAVSASNFTGANDNYKKIITQDDIENAKLLLKGKIEAEAIKAVKQEIEETNKMNNVQYEILGINDIIKFTDFDVYGIENYEIGQEIDSFELSGTIKITTHSYNKGLLISKMRNDIQNSILTDIEEVLNINSPSLRIANIISLEEKPYSIKATALVEVFIVHNFLSKNNAYVDRLKTVVAGLPEEDAQKILLNNNKISNVKIDIKPFFINNISKINDNIILKVIRD